MAAGQALGPHQPCGSKTRRPERPAALHRDRRVTTHHGSAFDPADHRPGVCRTFLRNTARCIPSTKSVTLPYPIPGPDARTKPRRSQRNLESSVSWSWGISLLQRLISDHDRSNTWPTHRLIHMAGEVDTRLTFPGTAPAGAETVPAINRRCHRCLAGYPPRRASPLHEAQVGKSVPRCR